jgi:hypothetical protein
MEIEKTKERNKSNMRKNLLILASGMAAYYLLIIYLPSKA